MPNLPISQLPLAVSGQPESWMAIVNYDVDPGGVTNKIYFSSVHLELQVLQEQVVVMVQTELMEAQVHQDPMVQMVLQEQVVLQDLMVQTVLQELVVQADQMVLTEVPVQVDWMDHRVRQVLMDLQEQVEHPESLRQSQVERGDHFIRYKINM